MFGLRDTDIVLIHNVLAKYPEVEAVTIYGSRATGNFKPASDIDLTVGWALLFTKKENRP